MRLYATWSQTPFLVSFFLKMFFQLMVLRFHSKGDFYFNCCSKTMRNSFRFYFFQSVYVTSRKPKYNSSIDHKIVAVGPYRKCQRLFTRGSRFRQVFIVTYSIAALACEQALRRAASAGREKEEELATTSLEFEYLHRKSRCEMQIGGHDIRSDVTSVFHVFLNVSLHSRWLAEICQLSRLGATGELEAAFNFQRRSCKLSFIFPSRRRNAPESLLAGYRRMQ